MTHVFARCSPRSSPAPLRALHRRALNHTEVLPEFGGHGIGTTLVIETLKQVRDLGGQVLPYCPFIPRVILDNPEFIDLVPPEAREQFGLE